jgi:hypothetical protein
MIIISWDVGVIHLAYCILSYTHNEDTDKTKIKLLDWDTINLIEDDRLNLICTGIMKKKSDDMMCGKKASYYITVDGEHKGFCKMHLKQSADHWSEFDTRNLFSDCDTKIKDPRCDFIPRSGKKCDKCAKFTYTDQNDNINYCTVHYKSELAKKIKELGPQQISNTIVKKYPTAQLQINLIKKLDLLAEHFSSLGVEEVVIENQPAMKNPKMKSISNTLFDYFLIRGYVDKHKDLNINLVRSICPSNKLKVSNDNTIEVFKNNKKTKEKSKYKLTKELGIQYTRQLLSKTPDALEYLDMYKKKDDLCDAYLQGRYYLEFIRNKTNTKKPKKRITKNKKSNSKTNKKSKNSKTNKKSVGKKTKKGDSIDIISL